MLRVNTRSQYSESVLGITTQNQNSKPLLGVNTQGQIQHSESHYSESTPESVLEVSAWSQYSESIFRVYSWSQCLESLLGVNAWSQPSESVLRVNTRSQTQMKCSVRISHTKYPSKKASRSDILAREDRK